jgi:TetR/AcrR family transcriptional repressor of nem operon
MKVRKKQPVQTRQAILDAADHEFSLRGYSGAGLGGIVTRAELTKGALFHHFPDKRALAAAWIAGRLGAGVRQLWVGPLDAADSLDDLLKLCRLRCRELAATDATSALVAIAAEVADQDPSLGDVLESVFADWRAAFAALLERGKSAGWIHASIKPEIEAELFVSAFSGFTVSVKISRSPETRSAFITALEGYLETLRVQ